MVTTLNKNVNQCHTTVCVNEGSCYHCDYIEQLMRTSVILLCINVSVCVYDFSCYHGKYIEQYQHRGVGLNQ